MVRLIHGGFLLFLSPLDVTPPSVQNCPASIVDRSNSLQKDINWTPPTFTDNVGVVSVLSNRQPGFSMQTYTSLTVRYTASDAAGNVVYCTFNITLDGNVSFEDFLKSKLQLRILNESRISAEWSHTHWIYIHELCSTIL